MVRRLAPLSLCVAVLAQEAAPEPRWHERDTMLGDFGGLRRKWQECGVTPGGGLVVDWSAPWSGSVRRRDTARALLDLNLLLESDPLLGHAGGSLYADAYVIEGADGNRDLGSLLGVSSLDAPERSQLAELWYQQYLLDDAIRVKAGKIDVLSEFGFSELAGSFVETSASWSPTLLAQPTYPDPATGVLAFVQPNDHWYFGVGVFDGATQDGFPTGSRGPSTFFSDSRSSSWYHAAEVGYRYRPSARLGEGRIAIGGFHHTGSFDRFDGGVERGTSGGYLIVEQELWREGGDAAQGLQASFRVGVCDDAIAAVHRHAALALSYVGPFHGRDADTLMLQWNVGCTSRVAGSPFTHDEHQLGVAYRMQVTPWFVVQPNLQWFVHAGGVDQDDVCVALIRFELTF